MHFTAAMDVRRANVHPNDVIGAAYAHRRLPASRG
jgi:hypothetical protein